jgi:hypothetical protein
MANEQLTAFGVWAKSQPRGVLTQIMDKTKLAWSTVSGAQKRLVSRDVAEALAPHTRGAVKVSQMVKPRRRRVLLV